MKPRDVPSKWVKVLPWYFTERRVPSRATAKRAAIEADLAATQESAPARVQPDVTP